MIVILLGPPGAGKGTQASKLTNDYDLIHISTGDIFRSNIKDETELGKMVKDVIAEGHLVSDDLTNSLVFDRISEEDCKNGFLLDGFPRNLVQAKALDDWLEKNDKNLTKVVNIEVDSEELIRRISGRRVCSSCGKPYHVDMTPSKVEGVCDICGGEVIQRPDDNEATVKDRINVYETQTWPLIEYYTNHGKLFTVDGSETVEAVYQNIKDSLE